MARRYKRKRNGQFATVAGSGGGSTSPRRKGESRRAARKRNLNKTAYVERNSVTGRTLNVTNKMREKRVAGALYGAIAGSAVGPVGTLAGARLGYLAVAGSQRKGAVTRSTVGKKKKVGNSTLRTQVSR